MGSISGRAGKTAGWLLANRSTIGKTALRASSAAGRRFLAHFWAFLRQLGLQVSGIV